MIRMSAISSNTLFHFTRDLDTLKSILMDQVFWPMYCVEYDKGKSEGNYYAIPMVCFCDIPLSQIREHIKDYGSFGVGLSKQWAKEKVSPVIYYNHKESLAIKLYNDIKGNAKLKDTRTPIQYFSLLKRYYGKTWSRSKSRYINKVLYNEREWRYVPRSSKLKLNDLYMTAPNPITFSGISHSAHLKEYSLYFPLTKVKYLFVESELHRKELISFIEKTFPHDERRILASRILTKKQLMEDF